MEVVILAAGIGRRFGGDKQLTPVAPDGATLLEVTLRDACSCGIWASGEARSLRIPGMGDGRRATGGGGQGEECPRPGVDPGATSSAHSQQAERRKDMQDLRIRFV